jgi:signal peptidase I
MTPRWLLSRTIRQATSYHKHVRKIMRAQRDLLSTQAISTVSTAISELQKAITSNADAKKLRDRMARLQEIAGKWLRPYPHAALRENTELVLVALAVALGIRTFFLQPFKIPTGSMQPTLYGIHFEDLRDKPEFTVPPAILRWFDRIVRGISYCHVVAKADGKLEEIEPPRQVMPLVRRQRFKLGGEWHEIQVRSALYDLASRRGTSPQQAFLLEDAGLEPDHLYRKGDDVIKLKVTSGDHLFVDRLTYNFRRPRRGEILVFKTAGILNPLTGLPAMPQDQFYIKRMVAMSNERVRIADDRHLVVNGSRLDHRTPHFENVYSFDPRKPPQDSQYCGHLNDGVAAQYGRKGLAPLFPHGGAEITLRPNSYMVMGDNTVNSLDSRTWGDFSRTNVIGKHCFVYWPISSRFGWNPY